MQNRREPVSEIGYATVTIEAIAARAGGQADHVHWWSTKSAMVLDLILAQQETEPGSRGATLTPAHAGR